MNDTFFATAAMPATAMPATKSIQCRVGCGACCIAPSISSAIPGMPQGKPAGVRCVQLSADNSCLIFGHPQRPTVCQSLQASKTMCGSSAQQALAYLSQLESDTQPCPLKAR